MFNFSGDLLVNNGLLIFADNIDPQLQDVVLVQLMRIGFAAVGRQAMSINEGSVR